MLNFDWPLLRSQFYVKGAIVILLHLLHNSGTYVISTFGVPRSNRKLILIEEHCDEPAEHDFKWNKKKRFAFKVIIDIPDKFEPYFYKLLAEFTVFKGGTALSKCFNFINRFSEDIDLVVLKDASLSPNQLKERLKKHRSSCGCPLFHGLQNPKTDILVFDDTCSARLQERPAKNAYTVA